MIIVPPTQVCREHPSYTVMSVYHFVSDGAAPFLLGEEAELEKSAGDASTGAEFGDGEVVCSGRLLSPPILFAT